MCADRSAVRYRILRPSLFTIVGSQVLVISSSMLLTVLHRHRIQCNRILKWKPSGSSVMDRNQH